MVSIFSLIFLPILSFNVTAQHHTPTCLSYIGPLTRIKGNIQKDSVNSVYTVQGNNPLTSAISEPVLMNTSYGKNSLKVDWSMEHWLWQLRWRQGPPGMHDNKEKDCLHGSVAFTHGNLDAPAACPGTGTEGTPNSPCPLHRCGIMLFDYTQAVFAVLQRERMGNERRQNRNREIEGSQWKRKMKARDRTVKKGRGTDWVSTWNLILGTGNTSICSPVLWC